MQKRCNIGVYNMYGAFVENSINGLAFMTAPNIGACHAFTTRIGGVSTGSLESLNLGEHRGDAPENVRENYRRVCTAAGLNADSMAFTRQVHGAEVRIVTSADRHELMTAVPYEADGVVTAEKGLTLVCFSADCVPVLLWDGLHGVAGAVHCGWRSSVADILAAAVGKMCLLGAEAESIRAAIGPAISRCCFEVGAEVVEAAEKCLGGHIDGLFAPEAGCEGKFLLDLKGVNARRLEQLGLRPENICVSDECTMCRPEKYWSHRRTGGDRGTQAGMIML